MATLEKRSTGIGKKPALVVIDASNGFTDPSYPTGSNYDTEVEAIRQLLERFRALGLPIYFTTVAYSSPEQGRVFRAKLPGLEVLEAGSRAIEIDSRIAPGPGETLIVKFAPSCFFETDLKERMRGDGVDTAFVVGFTTSGCVRASAVDCMSANFKTVVVRDGCGDRDPPAHEANLYDLGAKYADVVSLEEGLALLESVAVAA